MSPFVDIIKSSLSSLPPIRKKPRISVIIISSIEKLKSICGALTKLNPIFAEEEISFVTKKKSVNQILIKNPVNRLIAARKNMSENPSVIVFSWFLTAGAK